MCCSLQKVKLVCPSQYGQTVASELFHVPVSVRRMKLLKVSTASMPTMLGMIAVACLICECVRLSADRPHSHAQLTVA